MFGGHVSFQGSKLFIQTKWVVGRVAFDVFFFRVGKKKKVNSCFSLVKIFHTITRRLCSIIGIYSELQRKLQPIKDQEVWLWKTEKKLTHQNALQAGFREALASTTVIVKSFRTSLCED